jgi:hypothetical protein
MPTKEELENENLDLLEANETLTDENARLKSELADARSGKPAARTIPAEPSFGMCEGVRADLDQVPKTTDPFTGKVVTRDDVK